MRASLTSGKFRGRIFMPSQYRMRKNHYISWLCLAAMTCGCFHARGELKTAGELVVDLRAMDLDASSTTWTNRDANGSTVGNFVTRNGNNLNVSGIDGVSKALFVNGDNNNAVLSALNAPSSLLGNSTRSVEVWVYPVASSATSAAVGWGTSGNGAQSSFNYNTGGNGLFSGWDMDTGWNGSLATGRWIYLAYTYDGATLKGYSNGVLNKSLAFGPMATASAKLGVGAARAVSADGFKGYIADVRVHTGALSASDIANNFTHGIHSTMPVITGLANQTVVAGKSLVLNAGVTGFPQPVSQWCSNSFPLPGQTNTSLVLNDIRYEQNGTTYSLIATNLAGKVTNEMTLTVIVTPAIANLDNQAVEVGSTVEIHPTVSGVPVSAPRWLRNGGNVSDGATGNGSTISGSLTSSLNIANAQAADSGTYSLIASNSAGIVTNSMTLTVSSEDVPPNITGLADQTVVAGNNATFSASVSGLPLPSLQWRVNGNNLVDETGSSLTISNVQYSQDGFVYSLVGSNSAGAVTNSALLHVLVPPSVSQQPTNAIAVAGNPVTFSVVADGVPAVTYQWNRNGVPIANANQSSYTLSNPQGADNGSVFSVEVTNSAGVVASSNATLTVLSTMTGVLLPTNGAVNISPDQQLRIVFSRPPKLGSGRIYVRDASDDSLFAMIDTRQFQTFSMWSAVITNAAVRSVQGSSFYYMPIAIYGNEAWITFTNRFAYNKTYYVTVEANVFLDSANASFAPITGSNAWRFSTKNAGPGLPTVSSGPTEITVAMDGAGDFATLQGAADWIPQNNTLQRTITVQPGIYRDFTVFQQNRNKVRIIGAGADREDTQFIYPYPSYSGANDRGCGGLRLESSDIYVRNLTFDNQIYYTNNGVVFAGPINTVATTGKRLVFDHVLIKGGQDTLYTIRGIAYFNHCEIWGSVDFIYGDALAVFDQCDIVEIRNSGGPITAPSTPYEQPYGIVFLNCRFPRALIADGYPYDVGIATTTFQRPWRQDGYTALINCALGSQITTKGWSEWGGRETVCRAREIGTTLIAGGTVAPAQRQSAGAYWLNTIDPDYVSASMSPTGSLLYGSPGRDNRVPVSLNASDFTLGAIFGNSYFNLNGWLPSIIPTITSQPTNQTVSASTTAFFSVTAVGLPDPNFQWRKNGVIIPGATNATLTLSATRLVDNGVYSVAVSNSAGTIVSSGARLTIPAEPVRIVPTLSDGTVNLSWPDDQTGYRLQVQTNPRGSGLTTNWQWITNSSVTNGMTFPVNPSNGSVFYRLVYP